MDAAELRSFTPASLKTSLEGLPRRALQGLAKQYQIKANLKSCELARSLYERLLKEEAEQSPAGEADAEQREDEADGGGQGASSSAAGVLSPVGGEAARYTPPEQPAASPPRAEPTPPGSLFGPMNPLFFVPGDAAEQGPTAPALAGAADEAAAAEEHPAAGATAEQAGTAEVPSAAAAAQEATAGETGAEACTEAEPVGAAKAEGAATQPAPVPVETKPVEAGQPKPAVDMRRRVSLAAGWRSSLAGIQEWKDSQAQKLQELQQSWSTVSTGVAAGGKARTWKLPSANAVKRTASSLAKSGFTVVNSPGKNSRPPASGKKAPPSAGKRKAEGAPGLGAPLPKAARGSPMPGVGPRAGAKAPTPSRLRAASGPENAVANIPPPHNKADAKPAKPAGATRPPGLPKPAPAAAPALTTAERAKKAEAAFTARRVAALQRAQQAK